jgi:hypothetical protein
LWESLHAARLYANAEHFLFPLLVRISAMLSVSSVHISVSRFLYVRFFFHPSIFMLRFIGGEISNHCLFGSFHQRVWLVLNRFE